jgi:sugar lactone lactonase YvrE
MAAGLCVQSCQQNTGATTATTEKIATHPTSMPDNIFWQEYHEAYPVSNNPEENEVRSIAVDNNNAIWIATASGIFTRKANQAVWSSVMQEADKGPSFSVAVDAESNVWMGTWNGLYRFKNNILERMQGPQAPISVVCIATEGVYALGPHGVWLISEKGCEKKDYTIARSVRNAISDTKGGVWITSDVGLYHCTPQKVQHIYQKENILSAYVKGVALDKEQKLWVGGLGGVSILKDGEKEKSLLPENGLPSINVKSIDLSPDGSIWVGTEVGLVRYYPDGSHSLLFSRRWLLDDQVNDIAFDAAGTAWIATPKGVSAIKKRQLTLAQKQDYFYDVLMKRHIREPWIAGQCRLPIAGDISKWEPDDDDNDGEYTGCYLVMESFRYAATKQEDAREKARKAFNFLRLLQGVTGTDGFFARTIIPSDWTHMDDANRTFTARQLADELVKEPRFKPVEMRWRKSTDGKWIWKGDTSSDEMCGHMFGYFFYYELVADEIEKEVIRTHIRKIVDHLIANNYNMVDVDGTHTRWAVWSPDKLNRDPEWTPDRSQNSMELLAFMKLAYYVSGDEKYQQEYLRLINQENYLDNMGNIPNQNPAWFIYFDVMLSAYTYPILLKCEKDPKLLAFYENHIDKWMERRRNDHNPLINFIYCYARNKKAELANSVDFLRDTPLDLVDWPIDHTIRADVKVVHSPVLDETQINQLPPASIRLTVRWDKNPWTATGGDPHVEREPVFWLLPYWMGKYMG